MVASYWNGLADSPYTSTALHPTASLASSSTPRRPCLQIVSVRPERSGSGPPAPPVGVPMLAITDFAPRARSLLNPVALMFCIKCVQKDGGHAPG